MALSTGGPLRTIDLFHLQRMTVEHEQEGDEHVFRPHSSGPALARRLGVLAGLAGLAGQPRPAGERLWLSRRRSKPSGRGRESGAAGVRRILARVPSPPEATARASPALAEPQRVVRLEVFRPGAGARALAVSRGGCAWCRGGATGPSPRARGRRGGRAAGPVTRWGDC